MDRPEKVRVEVEIDRALLDLASQAGLDLSDVADRAVKRALGSERLGRHPAYAIGASTREAETRRWQRDNAEAIRLSNEELERNGLWCDDYRLF